MHIEELSQGRVFKGNEETRWVISSSVTDSKKMFVELDLIIPPDPPEELISEI